MPPPPVLTSTASEFFGIPRFSALAPRLLRSHSGFLLASDRQLSTGRSWQESSRRKAPNVSDLPTASASGLERLHHIGGESRPASAVCAAPSESPLGASDAPRSAILSAPRWHRRQRPRRHQLVHPGAMARIDHTGRCVHSLRQRTAFKSSVLRVAFSKVRPASHRLLWDFPSDEYIRPITIVFDLVDLLA